MPDIPIGTTGTSATAVTDENAIKFLGVESARVLATPWLIMHLEMTARDVVKGFLLDGQDTVGTQVNVRHLSATPIGMTAHFSAEVIEVQGQRVTFRVEAWDDRDRIAEGTHERYVIDIDRFVAKLQVKQGG